MLDRRPRSASRTKLHGGSACDGRSFAVIFLGLSFLAGQLGVLPDPTEQETIVSQITATF